MIHLMNRANQWVPVDLGLYPDNTPVVNYGTVWDSCGGAFLAMLLQPASMQEFFTGMLIVDSIKERGGSVESLVIPCIPGARQDRIKWEGDMLFTLKYVAKAINAQNFAKVITVDPHSMATTALIDRLRLFDQGQLYRRLFIENGGLTWDGVIAPDQGAGHRAEAAGKMLNVPVYYATKHRDPETNKLSGFAIDDLPSNSHYLVVDDLCDAGGTFLGLAGVIKENSATADLFVTHGLFTKGTEKLSKAYGKIYATDSWPIIHERVNYIKVTEGLI